MNKTYAFSLLALLMTALGSFAQKSIYIPDEWRNPWPSDSLLYAENDPDNKYTWSRSRSVESDNVVIFWDKGYGSQLPSQSPAAYRVDEQDLLNKCEAFYDLEINQLGFVDPETTNLRNYKVMVLLNHTTDWVCYGGGYDFEVSALWLGPSACQPVGHSVAHEVGHSFHYMCYADASGNKHTSSSVLGTGFHLPVGNGQAIWEQTAQWQANQSYPELMFSQSINVFRDSHNLAFSHEWHRYQSYWFLYFLCQYYDNIQTVGQVWRQPMTGAKDFNQALMALKGLDAEGLFRLYYDYAARCATWDFDACVPYRDAYIGDLNYRCAAIGDHQYQVALSSAPQSSGFNVIPLQVPETGTEVTVHFTALPGGSPLAEADPAELMNGEAHLSKVNRTSYIRNTISTQRAFRLGFVALMSDGTRRYFQEDSLYCKTNQEVTEDVVMTVPQGTQRLWMVVVPAPKQYVQHQWKESQTNAEHWPYRFEIEGTDISDRATVYMSPTLDGREVGDITLEYDVYMPVRGDYSATPVTVSNRALAMLGTAFQMQPSDIAGKMQDYASTGPSVGRIMFYPLNPTSQILINRKSTANGYGHWFNASGVVTEYASGYVYSEFYPSSMTFNIGQYPGRMTNGKEVTIGQALRYKQSDSKEAIARFLFHIHIDNSRNETVLRSILYEDPSGIRPTVAGSSPVVRKGIYTVGGQQVDAPSQHGVYVIDGVKKTY